MDTGDTLEARQKRSRVKAAGLPRQALTSLTSDGLAPHGPATFAKLKGKHPTAPLPSVHGGHEEPLWPRLLHHQRGHGSNHQHAASHCRWPVKPDRFTPPHLVCCATKSTPLARLLPWRICCHHWQKGKAHRSIATFFAVPS